MRCTWAQTGLCICLECTIDAEVMCNYCQVQRSVMDLLVSELPVCVDGGFTCFSCKENNEEYQKDQIKHVLRLLDCFSHQEPEKLNVVKNIFRQKLKNYNKFKNKNKKEDKLMIEDKSMMGDNNEEKAQKNLSRMTITNIKAKKIGGKI